MAVPGFSAEMSLFKSAQTYLVSGITSRQHSEVIPQMTVQCLVQALGLYQECLGTGYHDCAGELDSMFGACRKYT
jgi:hypothetical protein